MTGPQLIDLGNPVADHPLNRGRVQWLLPVPQWAAGLTWQDLGKRYPGTLAGGCGWDAERVAISANAHRVESAPASNGSASWSLQVDAVVLPATADSGAVFGRAYNSAEGFAYYRTATGRLDYYEGGSLRFSTATGSVPTGTRLRLLLTRAGTAATVYADGVAVGSGSISPGGAVALTGNPMRVGQDTGGSNAARLQVYGVSVWDRALSAAEAAAESDQARRGYPDLLRRYTPKFYLPAAPASGSVTGVQHVEVTIAAGATSGTAAITPVTPSRALVTFNGFTTPYTGTTVRNFSPRVELTNGTTVTAYRDTADATASVTVRACVVEFSAASGVSVQHGTVAIAAASTSNTAAVSAVTTSRAAAVCLGQTTTTSITAQNQVSCRVELTNGTTVTATRGATSTAALVVGYCVVEFPSAMLASAVQPRSVTLNSTNTSDADTITAVTPGNTVLLSGGVTSTTSTLSAFAYHSTLTDGTTVTLTRTGTATSSRTVNYTAVEFAPGVLTGSVQRGTTAVSSATSADAAVSTVDTQKTLLNVTGFSTDGSTTAERWASAKLLDATTVRGEKNTAGSTTSTVGWEAAEFVRAASDTQSIAATGLAPAAAVGSPTVSPGAATVTAAALASTAAFGAPAVTSIVTLAAVGIAPASALGSATVTPGAVTITATGIGSTEAFGSAALTPGTTVAATGIASGEAFGSATVAPGAITISATALASTEAFGSAVVGSGGSLIAATGLTSTEAFGGATVSPGPVTISATGIPATTAFGSAAVAAAYSVAATGIAGTAALGSPALIALVQAAGIASVEAFGSPAVAPTYTVTATGIAGTASLGSAALAATITVTVASIGPGTAFGSGTVTPGTAAVAATGLPSGAAVGTPSLFTPAPPAGARTVRVRAEARTRAVPAEPRTLTAA